MNLKDMDIFGLNILIYAGIILTSVGAFLVYKGTQIGNKKRSEEQVRAIKEKIDGKTSFPILKYSSSTVSTNFNEVDVMLLVEGEEPIYDVTFHQIDTEIANTKITEFREKMKSKDTTKMNMTRNEIVNFLQSIQKTSLKSGTYNPTGKYQQIGRVALPENAEEYSYQVYSYARNGTYFQSTKLKRSKNRSWKTFEIFISKEPKSGSNEISKTLFEQSYEVK